MQDIVFKKVERPSSTPPTQTVSKPRLSRKNSFVRGLLERLLIFSTNLGGWVKRIIEPKRQPIILQPASKSIPVARPIVVQKVKTSERASVKVKRESRRVREGLKTTAQVVKDSLRSPARKVAAIHTLAILLLFVYIVQQPVGKRSLEPRAISDATESGNIQQYLPTAREYAAPKRFDEKELASQANSVPLHTWVTPWNTAQLEDTDITYSSISAFWLTIEPNGSDVQTKGDWSVWKTFAANHKKEGEKNFLTISGDPSYTELTLLDQGVQQRHIATLLANVEQQGFDGIEIDYEGLGSGNSELFNEFIRNLTATFHAKNKSVAVVVEARIGNRTPMDWHVLGQIADQISIMVYDYHARNTNFPGPITPLSWLKEVLDYGREQIDNKKLVVALGNYGYDWMRPDETGTDWQGVGVSYDQAVAMAKEHGVTITRATGIDDRGYDIGSIPTFNYKDEEGKEHSVWFEDSSSLKEKITLINQYPVAGIKLWSVGLGDRTLYPVTTN